MGHLFLICAGAALLLQSTALAATNGCTAVTNRAVTCSSVGGWSKFSCGPGLVNDAKIFATLRNPGGNDVNLYWGSVDSCARNIDPYSSAFRCFAGTAGSTLPGTCNSGSVTSATVNVRSTYYATDSTECVYAACIGTGRIYWDFLVHKTATTYPSNTNPSGVTTCPSNTGISNSVGSADVTDAPLCLRSLYHTFPTVTGLVPGGSQTLTLLNPVGHKLAVFLTTGSSCGDPTDMDFTSLANAGTINAPTTDSTISLSSSCEASCCVVIACRNPSNWGACATISVSWSVTGASPSNTPTPSRTRTRSGTPSVTPTSSVTPSITPSSSVTPSVTPSTSATPSVTGTATYSPLVTPSPGSSVSVFGWLCPSRAPGAPFSRTRAALTHSLPAHAHALCRCYFSLLSFRGHRAAPLQDPLCRRCWWPPWRALSLCPRAPSPSWE